MRPRLGVLAYWPIQYHSPLYQRLAERGNVELDVLYLSDKGFRSAIDPEFGVPVAWDIDLLSGYAHHFLTSGERPAAFGRKVGELLRWLPAQDAVVVNGYASPWMVTAMALCRARGIPYLLRASSHPQGISTGMRRQLRKLGTRVAVAGAGGGLCMGNLNAEFYRRNHARRIFLAPNSVDNERFADTPEISKADLLRRWGLSGDRPVIMYCGKLSPRKRPLDLCAAIGRLPGDVTTIFVGDGVLADRVRASLNPGGGVVTGFINQAELPSYYHAADILVLPSEIEMWGLVINEGMAAGVLPVVTDRVGAASDLVQGVGHVYPCGDVPALAAALSEAIERVRDRQIRSLVQRHAARYSLDRTVLGFEEAALAVAGR
jgi:glycosyltransferase involved in cell wall biosynthesis